MKKDRAFKLSLILKTSVILTENGNYTEQAKVIVVGADIIDLNSILDNY